MKDYAKHSYVEQPKPHDLQAKTLKGPIYVTEDYKHHYQAIQEHLETIKNLTAPIYNKDGVKNLYNAILERVESLKPLKGPIYEFGEAKHNFEGGQILLPAASDMKTLLGPKYQIDNDHHFSEIIKQCDRLKELSGPVYDVGETSHSFRELVDHVQSLKPLAYPILVDEKHSYSEEQKKEDELVRFISGPIYVKDYAKHSYVEETKPDHLQTKTLKGPIYINDDYKHHYSAIQEHLETLKTLKGPVYDVESKNHYKAIMDHVESLKALQGPIYSFGDIGHKFEGGQILTPERTDTKTLHGPKYHIDNDHEFNEIAKKVDQLKELVGPIYDVGETGHHFTELKKHVESLRTLMGPVFMDERHRYEENY